MSISSPTSRQRRPSRRPRSEPAGASARLCVLALVLLAGSMRIRILRQQLRTAQHEASHDKLTGLPNRRAVLTRLNVGPVGLVGLLDLDRFKEVNDRYGHDVGDALLASLAQRLESALGAGGMVSRLAGDEFLILWTCRPANLIAEAERVLQATLRPLIIHGHLVHPVASLGLALPGPHLSDESLLAAADHAMYEAKGGNGIHLYADDTPPGLIDRKTSAARRSTRPRHRTGHSGQG